MAGIENLLNSIRLNKLFEGSMSMPTVGQPPIDSIPEDGGIFSGNQPIDQPRNRMAGSFESGFDPSKIYNPASGGNNAAMTGQQADRPVMQSDIVGLINSLYTPEKTYTDMYEKTLSERPERNKPGIGRKIAASALGFFGGVPAAEEHMYGGYNRKMRDWHDRMEALEPGLTAEKNTNANNRQLALSTATAALNERKQEEVERKNRASEQLGALKAQGWQLKTGEDGFVYAVSAVTGESKKTNVKSGDLSDAEKIRLQLDSALTQIQARGEIQTSINDADNATRIAVENANRASREEIAALRADVQSQLLQQRYELAGQNKWSTPVQAFDKDGKPLPFMLSTNGVTGEVKKIQLDEGVVTRVTPPGSGG